MCPNPAVEDFVPEALISEKLRFITEIKQGISCQHIIPSVVPSIFPATIPGIRSYQIETYIYLKEGKLFAD